jgi:hypothetical protein
MVNWGAGRWRRKFNHGFREKFLDNGGQGHIIATYQSEILFFSDYLIGGGVGKL